MKVFLVIECDAMVSYYIDRIEVCKTTEAAMKVVGEWIGENNIYSMENRNGKVVWVANDNDPSSRDSMIYIKEKELKE